jgi:hypothetical protein
MGLFTAKEKIMPNGALIGTNGAYDVVTDTYEIEWELGDWDRCMYLFNTGQLEHRGNELIEGVLYMKFYLPPPPHTHTVGP